MLIKPIVEGPGDVFALPELLRRLQFEYGLGGHDMKIARPIKWNRAYFNSELQIRRAVRLAMAEEGCAGILMLVDSDDDCPKLSAPQIADWSKREARGTPCEVVMAKREYEAWFLASLESLRGHRGIALDATSERNPEDIRGAKERLETRMRTGLAYSETSDQVALTCRVDLAPVYARCRSFRRLVSAFRNLLIASGIEAPEWNSRNI
jgi:hypothetical protein